MDRAQLFIEVLSDLNREDKADRLPGWLSSAEFRINENLRDDRMLKHVVLPVTETLFAVPPDWQETKGNIALRSGDDPLNPGPVIGSLRYFPQDQMDDGYADPYWAEAARGPSWFTTKGRNIELGGWNATGPFMVDMWYYANLPALTADTSTNWLLTGAPQVYKSIMEHFGFAHLQEFDTADRALVNGMAEIQALNDRNIARNVPSGPLIARPTQGFGARAGWRRR